MTALMFYSRNEIIEQEEDELSLTEIKIVVIITIILWPLAILFTILERVRH